MALRLYRTTRRLFRQVEEALWALGVPARVGSPTASGLIALYVTGLVLLDGRPSQTRISAALPARCHDALNRLLRTMPLSTRALMLMPRGRHRETKPTCHPQDRNDHRERRTRPEPGCGSACAVPA